MVRQRDNASQNVALLLPDFLCEYKQLFLITSVALIGHGCTICSKSLLLKAQHDSSRTRLTIGAF